MRGPYPGDLRVRVIEFVKAGGSRRDAAEHFEVSARVPRSAGCNAFTKMGRANRCPVEGALLRWRNIRSRFSPLSASIGISH
jgi:hypothetical protein